MAVSFDEKTRALLDGEALAVLATTSPKGAPNTAVMWFLRDGDSILFTTLAHSQKIRNLTNDPRVSVIVSEPANPYHYAEFRGTAEMSVDEHKSLPARLSDRYLGTPPPAEPDEHVRLIIRVTPEKVITFAVSPE